MRLLERSELNLVADNRITGTNLPTLTDPAQPDQRRPADEIDDRGARRAIEHRAIRG